MVNLLHKALFILFFILLTTETYAINIGSVTKNDFAKVIDGESTKFKVLIWNSEDEIYTMKLSVIEAPKDWIVIIDPDSFNLSKSIGEEYIRLPYLNENIKAKVVNVFVKPNKNAESGNYLVRVSARPEINENEIVIIPESIFEFKIEVESLIQPMPKKNILYFSENTDSHKKEGLNIDIKKDYSLYFYFFAIFLILIVSFIIYKKS